MKDIEPVFEISIDLDSDNSFMSIDTQATNVDYFSCRFFFDTVEPIYYYMKYDDMSYSIHIKSQEYVRTPANIASEIAKQCELFKTNARV